MGVSSKASLFPKMKQTLDSMKRQFLLNAADQRIQFQISGEKKELDSHALNRLSTNHEPK